MVVVDLLQNILQQVEVALLRDYVAQLPLMRRHQALQDELVDRHEAVEEHQELQECHFLGLEPSDGIFWRVAAGVSTVEVAAVAVLAGDSTSR